MKSKNKLFFRISRWQLDISSGRLAICALVIFLLFTAIVLPSQATQSGETSGEVRVPDLSFYYSADKLYEMAESYGSEGRAEYVRSRFTFDLIWPLVYAFFMVTSISWLTQKLFSSGSRIQFANLIPIFGADLDYLENVSTSIVMNRFPELTPYLANLAGLVTALKWTFVGGASLLILALLLLLLWRSIILRANVIED
jgi:hypothetical protein